MKLTSKQLAQMLVAACANKSGDQLEETMKEFVAFLAQRQELFRTREIIRQLDAVWREIYGAANVTIETAYPLTDDLRQQLVQMLRGADLKEKLDPELIGGAKLRIDDRLLDGSVMGKLMALKKTLVSK
ncbi:F0F1 ATP synthase subunit delta [Patescibacteria group bacterium]|nr:F0F1 ATP synthase subunit delta [Patescibacteria group bacterium]MBU1705158.1 F0F1 ATP synthase subunit delta [Patescibacteria group bacterium]